MPVAFVYHPKLAECDYGQDHPMRVERLKLAADLMSAYGLLNGPDLIFIPAEPAEEAELATFHRPDYLAALAEVEAGRWRSHFLSFGLGSRDNPIFPGMWSWSRLIAGAGLQAARAILSGRVRIAFNMAGGLHHAAPAKASGFCYVNDCAVVILAEFLKQGLKVAYVDVDAHHGDGVQAAFYATDRVLTISLHQHPRSLFPGTGYADEQGEGPGLGYSVNLPLWAYTDDDIYIWAFDQIVPPIITAYNPDILVTQLGVDTLHDDPLSDLQLSSRAFTHICRKFQDLNKPWLALGGGGYNLINPALRWTEALALMLGRELDDALPASFVEQTRSLAPDLRTLKGEQIQVLGRAKERAAAQARHAVGIIREKIFPRHGI